MPKSWWWKTGFITLLFLVSVVAIVPSLFNTTQWPSWVTVFFPKERLKLGLDLQGGLHLVLGVDVNRALVDGIDRIAVGVKEELATEKVLVTSVTRKGVDPVLTLEYENAFDEEKIQKILRRQFPLLEITHREGQQLHLSYTTNERNQIVHRAVSQSIETIRNRIDEFGVTEPTIQAQGTERVIIQLPGVKDPQRAKELIGRTAKLSFHLVDEKAPTEQLVKIVEETKKAGIDYETGEKFVVYLDRLNQFAKDKIVAESMISFQKDQNPQTGQVIKRPIVISKKAFVTGEQLTDARVYVDEYNQPYVSITFSPEGAKPFADVTAENVGRQLAIVLDHYVHSAPVIREKIPGGKAKIELGSGKNYQDLFKEAQDLSIVLRAGALPAPMDLLEERTVGPTLGQDSVRAGMIAILVSALLVVLFMIVYYRKSGLIADVALMLNVVFILSILVYFQAALSLPGIAGIVLTMGMAVDANVLIYERIREEIRLGKPVSACIEAGFGKALSSILDSNITTVIAGVILLNYGTGPIRGFAVTLIIGICTSLFTALVISRLIFDYMVVRRKWTKISI